jgi:hypothetical protein
MVGEVRNTGTHAIFAVKSLMTSEMDTIRAMKDVTMNAANGASNTTVFIVFDAIRLLD